MLKRFAVVAVLALVSGLTVSAATTPEEAQKEFKTTTKTALTAVKTAIATATTTYNDAVKTLITALSAGTGVATAHTTLSGHMQDAIQDVLDVVIAQNNAVDTGGSNLLDDSDGADNNAGPNNLLGFSEGDGGTLDKYNAAVKKLVDKFMATLAKSTLKVAKALEKGSAGGRLLAARVNPLRLPAPASPNATDAASVINSEIPLQVTHLISNGDTSVANVGDVIIGGTAGGVISWVLLDAGFATANNADNQALDATNVNCFEISSTGEFRENHQVNVGEGTTLTVGGVSDSIGIR